MSNGPYETERQAQEASRWVQASAEWGARKAGPMPDVNRAQLLAAIEAAGVTLGAFDRHVMQWLSLYEPATVAVIAGLIERAHEAGKAGLTDA